MLTAENAVAVLAEHGKRKIKTLMTEQGSAADAVMSLAATRQVVWTRPEWRRVLIELDTCDLRVDEWLPLNT